MIKKLGCVIPCFRGGQITLSVVEKTLKHVDLVVVVDDACPFRTGKLIETKFGDVSNTKVIFNSHNEGVGKSTKKGINYLFSKRCDVIIKLDADGQMNPDLIPELIKPIINGAYDAAKGNRFSRLDHVLSMPTIRIIGNLGLSFFNKLSTGYWELFDPTNGFMAFKTSALKHIRLDKVDDRYFFESDLLFQCALTQITFAQLPMTSVYGDEQSSLNPMREIIKFSAKHLINFLKRLVYQYFILDFNAGSLELMGVILGSTAAFIFALKIAFCGLLYKQYATPGESSLFAILAIFTTQMLIGFLYYDTTQQPLLRQLRSKT